METKNNTFLNSNVDQKSQQESPEELELIRMKAEAWDKLFPPTVDKDGFKSREVDISFAQGCLDSYEEMYNNDNLDDMDIKKIKDAFTRHIRFEGPQLNTWLSTVATNTNFGYLRISLGLYTNALVDTAGHLTIDERLDLKDKNLPRLTAFLWPLDKNRDHLKNKDDEGLLASVKPYNLGHLNP